MDYKFKHGDKVRVVRLNSQCTAIKVGDVFTIEGPLDRSFVGSNERIYSVQEKTLIFWEDELELVDGVQDNKEAANVEMVNLDFMIPKNNKKEAIRIANPPPLSLPSACKSALVLCRALQIKIMSPTATTLPHLSTLTPSPSCLSKVNSSIIVWEVR